MKKQIILIMLIFVMGVISGCNKDGAKTVTEEKGYGSVDGYLAAEGLVFDQDNIMFLLDSQINEAYVMCNRPNCSHDNEAECTAYFGDYRTYPIIYNGKIYYLEAPGSLRYTVWEQNIGENSQKKLAEIEGSYSRRFFVAYNGKLYYIGEKLGEDGLPLDGYNDVLIELDFETGAYRYLTREKEEGHFSFAKLDITGNTLYYVYNKYDPEYDELSRQLFQGDAQIDAVAFMLEKESHVHSYMYKINLDTLEETLYMDEEECESNDFLGIYDEYLVFYDEKGELYYTLNTEGEKEVFYTKDKDIAFCSLNVLGRKAFIQYAKDDNYYSITYDFCDKTFSEEVEIPMYVYIMFYNNVSDCVYARLNKTDCIISADRLIEGDF